MYPLSRVEITIQRASSDSLYYGRYPHGDKPIGAVLQAAADDTTAGGAVLTTRIFVVANAADAITANAALSSQIRLAAAASDTTSATAALTAGLAITNVPTAPIAGVFYSFQMTAANVTLPIIAWSATGLPPGLSIDSASGIISGTPTTTGAFNATIQLIDSA